MSEQRIVLPIPAGLAGQSATELYLPADKRSVRLLRLGTVDLGHWRLISLTTVTTPGGYPELHGTFGRIFL
jgi:hypothetical protein